MSNQTAIPEVDILVLGAHPDDAEIGMGGTIAKQTSLGVRVAICDMTHAEMSSNGTVDIRQAEAERAADILGLSHRSVVGLPDRGLHMVPDNTERVTAAIRQYRPRIVFAPYPQDRHPDHVACSHLAKEAVFNAKLRRYMPDLEPVTVESVFYYFINDTYDSPLVVDVTASYDQKKAALQAYQSQFTAPGGGNDYVSTAINQGYLEKVEARDRLLGVKIGTSYAEGFVPVNPWRIERFLPV
jgi:N-acetylglucosamine malate deacetylase 1